MKKVLFGFAFTLILASCGSQKQVSIENKTPLAEVISEADVTLIDVRIPEEYKEATANNAVNVPLAEIENNIDFFKKQKKVVVFCNRGIQADKAIEILKKNGVENVVDGTSWKNVKALQDQNKLKKD